jgi:N-acetylmuramoyl-L-alanine amidase
MPRQHIVRQGECLSQIAKQYGFADHRAIYDHPSNAKLRDKRPDPNLIFPGDRISIPDTKLTPFSCATGEAHRLTVKRPLRKVHLRLRDGEGEPLAGKDYALEVDGQTYEGSTDGDGVLERAVPADAREATLKIEGRTYTLQIGHLNPMENVGSDVSGIQARLFNLGYPPGPIDGKLGPKTRAAIRAFQEAQGLTVDGEVSPALIDKLKEVHGS